MPSGPKPEAAVVGDLGRQVVGERALVGERSTAAAAVKANSGWSAALGSFVLAAGSSRMECRRAFALCAYVVAAVAVQVAVAVVVVPRPRQSEDKGQLIDSSLGASSQRAEAGATSTARRRGSAGRAQLNASSTSIRWLLAVLCRAGQ
jgi:hypothetical protein